MNKILSTSNTRLLTAGKYCAEDIDVLVLLQEKSLSPSTSAQNVTPDTGYAGLGKVDIAAVTASIDSNIKAENIKQGISILGVTGTLDTTKPTLNKPVLSILRDALTITDNNGNFAKYNIYKNGTLLTTTASKTVNLSTYITSAGTYSITAKATGEHFNDSALSDAVSYTPTFKLVVSYANSTASTGTLVSVTPATLTFDNTKTAQNFTVTTGKSDLLYISNNDEYVVGDVTSTVSGDNKIYTVPLTPADDLIGTVTTTMTLKVVAGFKAVVGYEVLPASTATLNSITPTSLTYNSKTETHSFVIKVNENVSVSFNTGEYLEIDPTSITSETSGGIKTLTVPITLNENNIGSQTSVTATLGLLLNLPQLSAPTGLTADGTTVSWDAVENAESYDVYADDTVLLGNTTGAVSSGETWLLNETLIESNQDFTSLNFTSNSQSFVRIVRQYDNRPTPPANSLLYYKSDGTYVTAVYANDDGVGTWNNQAYRTLTFDTAPTGDLLTWLQANGTKQ